MRARVPVRNNGGDPPAAGVPARSWQAGRGTDPGQGLIPEPHPQHRTQLIRIAGENGRLPVPVLQALHHQVHHPVTQPPHLRLRHAQGVGRIAGRRLGGRVVVCHCSSPRAARSVIFKRTGPRLSIPMVLPHSGQDPKALRERLTVGEAWRHNRWPDGLLCGRPGRLQEISGPRFTLSKDHLSLPSCQPSRGSGRL